MALYCSIHIGTDDKRTDKFYKEITGVTVLPRKIKDTILVTIETLLK